MKRTLALLLVAVMAIACTLAVLTVSAEGPVYTDKVNLLPASVNDIAINGGELTYSIAADGSLTLEKVAGTALNWPSIVYNVNKEVDLSATPYLHMSFINEEGPEYENRGVNGLIYYTVDGGEEQSAQISAVGGNDVDDFRDTAEMYCDFAKFVGVNGKITVTRIVLSVLGDESPITWKALAFAKEGADDAGDDNNSSTEDDSSAPADSNSSTDAPSTSTSTPAESSKVPTTGDSGMILFAVLGVVALAGVAVTVKVRH